jgi:hypothetical protein
MTTYRRLEPGAAHDLIDLLEEMGIDFSIWNIEESLLDDTVPIEVGMTTTDWRKVDELMGNHSGIAGKVTGRAEVVA